MVSKNCFVRKAVFAAIIYMILIVGLNLPHVWHRNQQSLAILRAIGTTHWSPWLGQYQSVSRPPFSSLEAPVDTPLWRGRIALLLGDADAAYLEFSRVEPSSPFHFIGIAAAAALANDHQTAGEAWEKSQSIGFLWARVRWFMKTHDENLALEDLERLARITPTDPNVPAQVGTIFGTQGRWLEAANAFLRAHSLEQRHSYWRWKAARAFLTAGAFDESEALLVNAPKNDPYAQMILGDLYLTTGRFSEAAESYQRALDSGVHDPVYCAVRLSEVYAALGDKDREASARRLVTILTKER
jgi:tetratricopeptide (TPR) repeat protein